MEQPGKIGFKDLRGDLKTLVVFGWIIAGLMAIAFLYGYFSGLSVNL